MLTPVWASLDAAPAWLSLVAVPWTSLAAASLWAALGTEPWVSLDALRLARASGGISKSLVGARFPFELTQSVL